MQGKRDYVRIVDTQFALASSYKQAEEFVEQDCSLYGLGFFALLLFGVWFSVTRPAVKILEQTPNRLLFRIRPLLFWGVAVFSGGLGLLFLLGTLTITPVTTLTCNHSVPPLSYTATKPAPASVVCELVETNWLRSIKSQRLISGLQRVTLETKTETDSDGETNIHYRVVLLTDSGNIPLPLHYNDSDYEDLRTMTFRINAFVENLLDASLTVQQDSHSLAYTGLGLGGFLGLVSLLVIAAVPTITCTLAQETNILTLKRQKWFGAKVFKLSLDEISEVLVENGSDNSEGMTYRITLKLTSGEILPLTYSYSSGCEEKQQIAEYIRRFLRLHSYRRIQNPTKCI